MDKIPKIEIKNLNKNSLVKIVNLYEELNKISIIDDINIKAINQDDDFKKQLLCIKIESIKSSIQENSYIDKKYIKNFTFYYYIDNTVKIYMNKYSKLIDLENILNDHNVKSLFIINKNKKKKLYMNEINNLELDITNCYFMYEF
jgi:hypothetical protein